MEQTTSSPPITPIRQFMSPFETSPTSTYREQFARRTSSFSSNNDRSPTSIRRSSFRSSRNRFSNASQYSNDFSPDGGGGGNGMGNLADELDQLDDYEEVEEEIPEENGVSGEQEPPAIDGARDSGIDVSYESKRGSPLMKNFSKPFPGAGKPPDHGQQGNGEPEEKLSSECEDLISSVARMASYAGTSEDPLIPRVVASLQDLGNQSGLEVRVQRLNTSTNSMTANLTAQSKTLQGLVTSLYSPLALFTTPLDPQILDETGPLIEALLKDLPIPDPAPLQGLQKLIRDTDNVTQTLSQLTDTLQMGKHVTNEASRHLRNTQRMVAELRRERERADLAREELKNGNWHAKIEERWCAKECKDIMGGFEEMCNELRDGLVQSGGGAQAVAA